MSYAFALLLLGLALVYSPVPGLGILLAVGAAAAIPVIILRIWMGA